MAELRVPATEVRAETAAGFRSSRRETAAVSQDRGNLVNQRETARAYTASTGSWRLRTEGRADQAKGNIEQAGAEIEDASGADRPWRDSAEILSRDVIRRTVRIPGGQYGLHFAESRRASPNPAALPEKSDHGF